MIRPAGGRVRRTSKSRGSGRAGSGRVWSRGFQNLTRRVRSGQVGLGDPTRPDPRVFTRPVSSPGFLVLSIDRWTGVGCLTHRRKRGVTDITSIVTDPTMARKSIRWFRKSRACQPCQTNLSRREPDPTRAMGSLACTTTRV